MVHVRKARFAPSRAAIASGTEDFASRSVSSLLYRCKSGGVCATTQLIYELNKPLLKAWSEGISA